MNGRRQNLLNGRTALLLAGTGLICVVAVAGTLEKSMHGWIHTVAVVLLAALFLQIIYGCQEDGLKKHPTGIYKVAAVSR